MRNQWASIFTFSLGVVIVVVSMFLESFHLYTGFWLVTSVGFTVIAASLVIDGKIGTSNPRITEKPTPRPRITQAIVASTMAFIRNSRKR